MNVDIYKELTFTEDERARNPKAYYKNGNRKCQHIDIVDKKEVIQFIKEFKINSDFNERVCISVLWHLPRKIYKEKNMWVCVSGVVYGENLVNGYDKFKISDNIVTKDAQDKAIKVLDYLNSCHTAQISYPRW